MLSQEQDGSRSHCGATYQDTISILFSMIIHPVSSSYSDELYYKEPLSDKIYTIDARRVAEGT